MRVWRLCSSRWRKSAFSGEGARIAGGRWNRRGTAVVYCSGSLSLAVVEALVHLGAADFPTELVAFRVEIPDTLRVERLSTLPRFWQRPLPPDAAQSIGSSWVERCRSAVLEVPSAAVPGEHNYLLNPRHSDFARISIGPARPFAFDPRLLRSAPSPAAKRSVRRRKARRGVR